MTDDMEEAVRGVETWIDERIEQKLSDYLTEEEAISLIDERATGGGNKGVEEALKRIEDTRRAVELPGRKVGPTSPDGSYHTAPGWGIHFRVKGDVGDLGDGRGGVAHIRNTTVDSDEQGSFDVVLGKYDGEDEFNEVARKECSVNSGVNNLHLDFALPQSGDYLLTREGSHPLRRGEFGGWDDHMNSGVQLIGGSKVGDWEKPNQYWYYFHDLEIAASIKYHLED